MLNPNINPEYADYLDSSEDMIEIGFSDNEGYLCFKLILNERTAAQMANIVLKSIVDKKGKEYK